MNEIKKAFVKLLEQKKFNSLKDLLTTMNPSDIAACMAELGEESLAKIFRLLPKELARRALWRWTLSCRNSLSGRFPTAS